MCLAASDKTAVARSLAQAFATASSQNINAAALAAAQAAARKFFFHPGLQVIL
jgi:hypothetical protein